LAIKSRTFKKGDSILIQGASSSYAYMITKGSVIVSSSNKDIASLQNGDFIGEYSLLNNKPSPYSYIAQSDVELDVYDAEKLAEAMKKPELSQKIIQSLSKKIDNSPSDPSLPKSQSLTIVEEKEKAIEKKRENKTTGFIDWLLSLFSPKNKAIPSNSMINILLPVFVQDKDGKNRDFITKKLESIPGINIIKTQEIPDLLNLTPDSELNRINLMIIGEVISKSNLLKLRFVSPLKSAEYESGSISLRNSVNVRIGDSSKACDLILPITLSQSDKLNLTQAQYVTSFLPLTLKDAEKSLEIQAKQVDAESQAHNLYCHAMSCIKSANITGNMFWHNKAIETLKDALSIAERNGDLFIMASLQLGLISLHNAEKKKDMSEVFTATSSFENILDSIIGNSHPDITAIAYQKLGSACYLNSFLSGETAPLKEAISSFKEALKYYSPQSNSEKWAEVSSQLAKAYQLYGDQSRSGDAIKQAIQLFAKTLNVRSKEEKPTLWAVTQNNIGSALFMLAKYEDSQGNLEKSVKVFEAALEIYKQLKMDKSADITAKNLKRAKATLANFSGRGYLSDDDDDWKKEIMNPSDDNDDWIKALEKGDDEEFEFTT